MKNKILLFITFTLILLSVDINAQCAMCKAVVETNLETGDTKGLGLNNGILYLMAIPYIAALVFGIIYYLQNKKSNHSLLNN
tara:strand:- start:2689 stop:2934 length:246 start_codon:yes stop_codon:yes gene_type:complete